ncbi:MAG: hypothetical protein Q9165_001320 [Trypethelium subeluteriae]
MAPYVSTGPARPQPVTQGTQSTVFGIIAAFASGLDVLKKFRAQDRGRRRRPDSSDELQLSKSLRRSPTEIHNHYERGYNTFSNRFADGDVVAQAALAGTLLKLNSGLVEIVSTFLANPKSKSRCDFSPLIKLSDESRREAVDALNQLYQRLSSSQSMRPSPVREPSNEGHSRKTKPSKQPSSPPSKNNDKARKPGVSPRLGAKAPSSNTTVSKVAVRGLKVPQYAFIRQRPAKRSISGSSESSGSSAVSASSKSSQSTALTTPSSSPGSTPYIGSRHSTPPPRYVSDPVADQNARQQPTRPRRKPLPSQLRQVPNVREQCRDHPEMAIRAPTTSPLLPQAPACFSALPSRHPAPNSQANFSVQELPMRRSRAAAPHSSFPRLDPSRTSVAYSIATDSTKLGEIPMHKWSEPYDFDAMDRMNKEAALWGWVPPPPVPDPGRRRGFWSLFKKGKETD